VETANERAPTSGRLCRVTADYRAQYSDPISVRAGEALEVSGREDRWDDKPDWVWLWCTDPRGKSGWMPQGYVELIGGQGRARRDYAATELSVSAGETVNAEQEESGWLWCTNQQGGSGWVPADHVECP
jgi:hypothetical protein